MEKTPKEIVEQYQISEVTVSKVRALSRAYKTLEIVTPVGTPEKHFSIDVDGLDGRIYAVEGYLDLYAPPPPENVTVKDTRVGNELKLTWDINATILGNDTDLVRIYRTSNLSKAFKQVEGLAPRHFLRDGGWVSPDGG